MNWRIGLALTFLLILLFAILHLVTFVIPPIHNKNKQIDFQDVSGAVIQPTAIGQISENSLSGTEMQITKNGNVVYPYLSPMNI